MASTVIDSLVVLLGLDASNYRKGREEAEKETKETARVTKNSADEITKSLSEVGRTIAGLFLGFETATGLVKWLGGLNASEASLGRTAKILGISAHELNKWDNAVVLAGGSAEDAQGAFRQLTEDFQKMNATGEQSALLQFIRARGVNIRDQNGQLRNQGEIYEELADKTAQYGAVYQATMFRQAGLNEGEINYLVRSRDERAKLLQQAEANNAVTEDSVLKAQQLQQEWRNVSEQITAAGQAVIKDLAPAVLGVLHSVNDIAQGIKYVIETLKPHDRNAPEEVQSRANVAREKYKDYLATHRDIALGTATPNAAAPPTSSNTMYVPPAGTKAARYNNPGNILDAQGNERRYATPEEGAEALEKDLRAKMARGLKTVDAIITAYEGGDTVHNDIPAYIADVQKRLGKNQLSEADIKQLAYAMSTHENGPSARAAPVAGGSTTNVQVDKIEVHSATADPRAVAEQVPAAIQRKFTVAQADTGQS